MFCDRPRSWRWTEGRGEPKRSTCILIADALNCVKPGEDSEGSWDSKGDQTNQSYRNQPWIFIKGLIMKLKFQYFLSTDVKELTIGKDLMGKAWGRESEDDAEKWILDGVTDSLEHSLCSGDRILCLACCSSGLPKSWSTLGWARTKDPASNTKLSVTHSQLNDIDAYSCMPHFSSLLIHSGDGFRCLKSLRWFRDRPQQVNAIFT